MGKKDHGTKLVDLPDDSEEEIDSTELYVLNGILNTHKESPQEYERLKYIMYATAVFFMLSLPFTDRILELSFPMANSWLILVGMKTVIFFIVYYIVFYINNLS